MTKKVQDLHNQYNKFEDIIKLQLVHQYNPKTKEWKFNGYRCRYCDTTLMYPSSIQKHPSTCKELNKTYKREKDEPFAILTKDHKIWKPMDIDKTKKNSF